jgi:hypothetical protein
MNNFFPHGWHARAHLLPAFPPPHLRGKLAVAIDRNGLGATGYILALFHPNLALDAQGVALALDERDWNALVGLAHSAGCLAPELEVTGRWMRESYDEEDEDYNIIWRWWEMETEFSHGFSNTIISPYTITVERRSVHNHNSTTLNNPGYTTFSLSGFQPTSRNLVDGRPLPQFLHEIYVVLWETYNERLDAPSHAIDPWLHMCTTLAYTLGEHPNWRCSNDLY